MRASILLVVPLLLAPAGVEAGVSAERLRQRVAEELLRDGISLERLGQELQLAQPTGEGWRVRLVDAESGEVLEQRMVDRLPAGKRAAVAELVVVVSSMVQRKEGPAARWRDTLPIEAVRSHLSGGGLRIAVVGAGSGGDVETAAETPRAVLREAGAKMVVGSETLGDLSTAADPEIVERAADLPVDEVHVLRLFPGTGSDPETFVVTMCRPGGDVLGAYSGTAGTGLDAKAATAGSRGVSNKTAAAVSELTENGPGHDEALEEYEKRAVWFQDMVGINAQAGAIVVST